MNVEAHGIVETRYVVRAWSTMHRVFVVLVDSASIDDARKALDELAANASDDWHHVELVRSTTQSLDVRARPEGLRRSEAASA